MKKSSDCLSSQSETIYETRIATSEGSKFYCPNICKAKPFTSYSFSVAHYVCLGVNQYTIYIYILSHNTESI